MAIMQLRKAQRSKAFLKLGMAAPAGGGKTLGSLLIAFGLVKGKYPQLSDNECWEKIAIIDTENGSGELYVNKETDKYKVGQYNAITLTEPFEIDKYLKAIELCEDAGMEVCIIDSLTHAWSGSGGLLEQQNQVAKRTGNSWTAWRDISPQHNKLVEKMLQCNMHVIASMRSEMDYAQEKTDDGKTVVKKLGLAPIQRKGMEFEFTLFLDINSDHEAFASKDRTSIYDQKTFKITPQVGKQLVEWLESGTSEAPQVVATLSEGKEDVLKHEIQFLYKQASSDLKQKYETLFKEFDSSGNPNKIKDTNKQTELIEKMKELKGE